MKIRKLAHVEACNSLFSRGWTLKEVSDGYLLNEWDTTCDSDEYRYITTAEAFERLNNIEKYCVYGVEDEPYKDRQGVIWWTTYVY